VMKQKKRGTDSGHPLSPFPYIPGRWESGASGSGVGARKDEGENKTEKIFK